jgi:hypothetical protein
VEELQVQTRFLRLYHPAVLGDRIDGWRVCWIGGWDKTPLGPILISLEKALKNR